MKYCIFLDLCAALFFLCTCSNRHRTKEIAGDETPAIPLFSEHECYETRLSAIALNVSFISLEIEPPLNDSKIGDVQLSDEYVFLSDISQILQYDKSGTFIREIGRWGNGPEEYVQVFPPIQVDYGKKLIYVVDGHQNKILCYGFDGKFVRSFPNNRNDNCIALIDEHTIAGRQTMSERRFADPCRLISFFDTKGKPLRSYQSHLYPIDCEKEVFGPEVSFLWEYKKKFYYLEYGADTIFCINDALLTPQYTLTGKLKVNGTEIFSRKTGRKQNIFQQAFRPYSAIFESESFLIFRIADDYEHFFIIYDKYSRKLYRTFYKDPKIISRRKQGDVKAMDYFVDDLVSGLSFNPQYQSYGKAIALIPATEIAEKREDILCFIAAHPSDESVRLKALVEKMDEFDNPLVMIVTFK
jgi:hypothetical protein